MKINIQGIPYGNQEKIKRILKDRGYDVGSVNGSEGLTEIVRNRNLDEVKDFNVFVLSSKEEAAKKLSAENGLSENKCSDIIQNKINMDKSDAQALGIPSTYDMKNYQLIIDTVNIKPELVAEEIEHKATLFLEQEFNQAIEVSPAHIYPTQNTRDLSEDRLNQYVEETKDKNKNVFDNTIYVSSRNDKFYAVDGHHRLLAANRNEKDFISVSVDDNINPQILDKSSYYDFEDIGNFRYDSYPEPTDRFIKNEICDFSEKEIIQEKEIFNLEAPSIAETVEMESRTQVQEHEEVEMCH